MSFFYSVGSMLLVILISQVFSGVLLTFSFTNFSGASFKSVDLLSTKFTVIIRWFHVYGASLFFLFLYLHLFRGLVYCSYKKVLVWTTGLLIFFLAMISAFLGYTLPWGQMSFWATTVITSFLSVIPYLGEIILGWILSSFIPSDSVLKFFFCLHVLFPLLLFLIVMLHMFFLHSYGSMSVSEKSNSISFFYYILKDMLNLIFLVGGFMFLGVWSSFESLNFVPADFVVSPAHIKPEWYFLFLYAILRCVPHKLTGVLLMVFSLVGFMFLVFSLKCFPTSMNYLLGYWLVMFIILLTWIGSKPVMDSLNFYSLIFTFVYFLIIFMFL